MHPLLKVLKTRQFRIAAAGALALVVLWAALFFVFGRGKDLDARHRPFAFEESFDFATGTFADYIAWSERRVRAARGDAADATVIANLLPFRMEPGPECTEYKTGERYHAGVVLTHDVLDSAYTQRKLGEYFQSRCLVVYGLLLPGHGSQPGELLRTRWQEWAAAESFAVRALAQEAEYVYLAGHGAGGTLAILEASTNAEIDGLVLFAPQLDAPAQSLAARIFGWLVPGARWASVVPAYTAYRYESRPWPLNAEVAALVEATLEALPRRSVEVPVLTVLSQDDATASTSAMLEYMAERVHPQSATLIYGGDPAELAQPGRQIAQASYPERGLLGLSHLGLMLPMEDPEFGWYGAAHDCGHYYRPNPAAYATCMAGERAVMGEVTEANLAIGVLERTEFNPFFYIMVREIDRLVAPVAKLPGYTYEPR
jgi:esterase/lipase